MYPDSRDVERANLKVQRTGSAEDLRQWLRLRERYERRVNYNEICRQEAKLIGKPDPEGARAERELQRQINEHNAQNKDGFYD